VFQTLNNIGVCYLKLENYPKALDIFQQLDSLHPLDASTIAIPVNLGFIYYELKEYDKAEAQLMRVFNYKNEPVDKRAMGLSTFKMGEVAYQKKEYPKALTYFNRSIAVYDSLQNDLEKVQSLDGIALTYLEMKELDKALEYAERAFNIAHTSQALPEQQLSTETLYKVYKAQERYQESLSYLEFSKSLSDSLKNVEISREVGALEAEYRFKDQDLKFREAQQRKNLENAKLIANKNLIIFIILAVLALVLIASVFQYRILAPVKGQIICCRKKTTILKSRLTR
jgi:tetratricopeptide (TPR) repeat protein